MGYLVKRITIWALFFFFFTIAIFLIGHMMPGSMADYYFGGSSTPADTMAIQSALTSNHSLLEGYLSWLKAFFSGDLGYSIGYQMAIMDIIIESMMASMALITVPLMLSFFLALPLGIVLAIHSHGRLSNAIHQGNLVVSAVPALFIALLAQYFLSIKLNILPISSSIVVAHYLTMPKLIIFITNGTFFTRSIRALMLMQLSQPYYQYGGYLGLKRYYFYGYWLVKPLLSSLIVLFNGQLIASLGGMLLIETIFDYHGMGRLLYQSVLSRDIVLLMAITTILFIISSLLYLLADCCTFIIDRRNSSE